MKIITEVSLTPFRFSQIKLILPTDDTFRQLQQWIDAPPFASEYERALHLRERGTSEWLYDDTSFVNWRSEASHSDSDHSKLLWVHGTSRQLYQYFTSSHNNYFSGKPGCGKTVLAASTIEELSKSENTRNTCYFFFRHCTDELDSLTQAYRSILAQTLWKYRNQWSLLHKFTFLMDTESSGQLHATQKEMLSIIQHCAHANFIHYLVLDGIDECSNNEELLVGLLETLRGTNTRVILFSRPHCIPLTTPADTQLAIGKSNAHDIKMFIIPRVQRLLQRGLFPANTDLNTLIAPLLTGANDMFLWAHLMLKYLESPGLSRMSRLQEIKNIKLPEGLDQMYERVFDLLSRDSRPNRDIGKYIFTWLTFSCRQLTAPELEAILTVRAADVKYDLDFADLDHTIITCCASLVEKNQVHDPSGKNMVSSYCFMHLSVSEFLKTRLCHGAKWFLLSSYDSHLLMARQLIQYLKLVTNNLRPQKESSMPPSESATTSVSLVAQFPLCEYALLFWGKHLEQQRLYMIEAFMGRTPAALDGHLIVPPFHIILEEWRKDTQRSVASTETALLDLLSSLAPLSSEREFLAGYIELSYIFKSAERIDYGAIAKWFQSTIQPHGSTLSYSKVPRSIVGDLVEVLDYLKRLQVEWGRSLTERPFLIWTDVAAFTPHQVLASSETSNVYSELYMRPKHEGISSQYLCKVSGVSIDQKLMGVLTIWPPK